MKWFCILASAGFAVSAIIRPTVPATTLAPSPLITSAPIPVFARQITSCALVSAPAFTIDGKTYPASSSCTCNGGVQAGASRTVGSDGKTTWECAANSTPMPISTEEPAPTTTWVMDLLLGNQKFMIGDYDQSNFLPLMKSDCGEVCDAATQEHIKFNWTHSGGSADVATGTVVMTGVSGNSATEQTLLTAVNAALLKSSQCTQVTTAFYHNTVGKREIDPPLPDLVWFPIPQCHVVSGIQAMLYNGNPDNSNTGLMAQMTFSGSSKGGEESFACSSVIGDINEALSKLRLVEFAKNTVVHVQAQCV